MMKQLASKNPFSCIVVKFAGCFVFLGFIAYWLFSSSFLQFPILVVTDTIPPPEFAETYLQQPPSATTVPVFPTDSVVNDAHLNRNDKCDLFKGEWIPDPSGPYYTNSTCFSIEGHQNCMKNGRPDTEYLFWRWNPTDCDLPKFDASKFLEFMRDKSMAFIGDSIMRNHAQSLVCTLSQVEEGIEVYHDKEYKSKRWNFPSYGFKVSVVWSPFLSKANIFEDDNGVSTGTIQLHPDKLDPVWTNQFKNFDYIFIAGGKWFLKTAIYYENETVVGCHNCQGNKNNNNIREVGFEYAYRKALNSTLKFIGNSEHKVYTFFRTTTPDHFENGEWNTGGYCNRTKPFKEGEVEMSSVDKIMREVEIEEFESAADKMRESGKGLILKLFDTTNPSLLRPDGHPGVYRQFQPPIPMAAAEVQNDCLHWCLPGPIDSWNDLMLETLIRS